MSRTAAIIGGGVIGGGWAARLLLNGWNVQVFDPDPKAKRKIGEVLANARHALPMLYDFALPPEGNLSFHDNITDTVKGALWVQESVPERLDIKHKVFADVQATCPMDAVIASSTSGFKPSELQQGAATPGQIMVAHPFNPVYLLPLIELVPTAESPPALIKRASEILTSIGLFPLHVRHEIDAHIADRFLEAVWREALWLIKDDIATTEEIDNAIRYGFGLRWAQMGLFETYRIAGGEAGMKHFIDQFGPCLKWPWTKLMDVPELTDDLTRKIADQSDAQSGSLSIRELERKRDNNLIAMMRALKQQNNAAGRLINAHQKTLQPANLDHSPMITVRRTIPIDWTDYNGHMNEGRYGQVFSDAADVVMLHVGADADYIAGGMSYFTAETTIKYLDETHAGEMIGVTSRVTLGEGKKLRLFHEMKRASDGVILSTCDQFLLHVDLTTRRSCDPLPGVQAKIIALAALHKEA
ncbi:Carnitine 3-dehydrogenase / Carnitine utilization associated thioesterase [hydrothermal vent metagenome]|uniref:carnitine 3-dehydrogenase n=1 Tax=hydrothermal vent metagenome TaxID=652676 RepID=A0A3B0RP60_9ZZZZ